MTWAVVITSEAATRTVATPSGSARVFVLTGELDGTTALLGGAPLQTVADGTVPTLTGEEVDGAVEVPPASVVFVVDDAACNACG